ncbi:MAG: YraN family protein [candidate division KSB1 bacterium]|nr:YraN family protein [candidate division KSB1 bacterium]MDZ7337371.1 YraN family protein [candidate division KSB1 bacterium]
MSEGRDKKPSTRLKGTRGEEVAVSYLRRKGYQILSRNYRCAQGEIDIVAKDGPVLVFVEVKAGRSRSFGPPECWVDRRKQEHMGQAAAMYLEEQGIEDVDCRFDVIAVVWERDGARVQHIENAFWL